MADTAASDAVPDPPSSSALAATADPALVDRMQAQLEDRARGERTAGLVTGIVALVLGAALIGTSIWLSVDDEAFGGAFGTPNPAAITGLALAPLLLATGIYTLAGTHYNADRLARWRAARDGALSPVELGRFEGELRAEANAARTARWGSFALGAGLLVGGVVTVILGAALDGFDDEFRGYVIGGGAGFTVLGGILMGVSFLESSTEQLWDQYQRGDEEPEVAGLRVQPYFGPGGVGLVGAF